jgi:hypothetical protein
LRERSGTACEPSDVGIPTRDDKIGAESGDELEETMIHLLVPVDLGREPYRVEALQGGFVRNAAASNQSKRVALLGQQANNVNADQTPARQQQDSSFSRLHSGIFCPK